MGRVTIFSLSECPHCQRSKELLSRLEMRFVDISISDYPEKRNDMLQLADRLTVPQIFFNARHIGGSSDLHDLHKSGALRPMHEALLAEPDPADPRLAAPDYPPEPVAEVAELEEAPLCVGESCDTYSGVTSTLLAGLAIADRTHHLMTYRSCFVGVDAVSFLHQHYKLRSRAEAVQVGRQLRDAGLFDHVLSEHDFKDETLFYRLQQHAEPVLLNSWRVWNDRVDDALLTVHNLKKRLGGLVDAQRGEDGLVDYIAVAADPGFRDFLEASCELQGVSLAAMVEDERLAFCINLYNLMVPARPIHGVHGAPTAITQPWCTAAPRSLSFFLTRAGHTRWCTLSSRSASRPPTSRCVSQMVGPNCATTTWPNVLTENPYQKPGLSPPFHLGQPTLRNFCCAAALVLRHGAVQLGWALALAQPDRERHPPAEPGAAGPPPPAVPEGPRWPGAGAD
jgi:glutaredoxin 3